MKKTNLFKCMLTICITLFYSCTPMKTSYVSIDISPYNKDFLNNSTETLNDKIVNVVEQVSLQFGLEKCERLEKIEDSIAGFCREWQGRGDTKLTNPTHPWVFDLVLIRPTGNHEKYIIQIAEYQNLFKTQFCKELQTTLLKKLHNAYPEAVIGER